MKKSKWHSFPVHHDKVMKWWNDASALNKQDGMRWYARANEWCEEQSSWSGYGVDQVAGIVAALSPGCPWERNLIDAYAILERKRHKHCTYPVNVSKAIKIRKGKDPLDVLGGRKVRAFYSLISNPLDQITVCVDRHAVKVLTWHEWKDENEAQGFLRSQWDRACQVYRDVAQEVGVLPHQVQAVTWLHQREMR